MELKRPGFRVELVFTPDASSCLASYDPFTAGPPLTDAEFRAFLSQCGVTTGVREEAFIELAAHAAQGKALRSLLLACASPMVPGEDGRIEQHWSRSQPERTDDSDDAVDFHQVQEFFNVKEGDVVATIVASGQGTPGLSVFGTPIPAPAGRPVQVRLGKSVTFSDNGATIIATDAGRVFCQGGEVSVEDTYQVSGNVDFKVGNIDFNGFVEVTGDVLDGFHVRASKGIKIQGNVGGSSISSDGDVSFCGMNGQGAGVIRCGGTLRANFIYETKIEVAGDLITESEIRLCAIKSLGAVQVNRGGIVGGECVALAGVAVGSLGSVTSLHTRVVVGVCYRDLEELSHRFDELREVAERQKLAQGSKGHDDCLQERAAIAALIREIRTRSYERANAKINVRKVLHGGVTVSLGSMSEEFREERPGPFSMIENTVEGGIRFLELTDLGVGAAALEAAYVRQAQLERVIGE